MRTVFSALAVGVLITACGAPTTEVSTTTTPEPSETPEATANDGQTEVTDSDEKVTLAQYEQVSEGMTLEEIEAVLGEGTEISSSEVGGIKTVMYEWEGSGEFGANMNVMLQDGALISKSQFGLK